MAKESSHLIILPLISTYIRIISTYIRIISAYFIAAASAKHMHPLTSHSLGNMPEGEDDSTTSNIVYLRTHSIVKIHRSVQILRVAWQEWMYIV